MQQGSHIHSGKCILPAFLQLQPVRQKMRKAAGAEQFQSRCGICQHSAVQGAGCRLTDPVRMLLRTGCRQQFSAAPRIKRMGAVIGEQFKISSGRPHFINPGQAFHEQGNTCFFTLYQIREAVFLSVHRVSRFSVFSL